jgi:hypothetical protein
VRKTPLDRPTIAAIGALSGLLMLVDHEVLGHALVTVALGAHLVHLTSVDSSYSGPASDSVMRVIASAGIVANLLAGWLVLSIARRVPAASPPFRYFAWFFGHATLFMGSSYLAGLAFLPVGDVHAAIGGLRYQLAYQIVCLVAGIAIYRASYLDMEQTLGLWMQGDDGARESDFTVIPYVAMGITNTVAGLLNPNGAIYGAIWAAAATFGASSGFLFASAPKNIAPGRPRDPLRIVRSPAWIGTGVAATIVLFAVLGPGIPR